MDGWDVDPGDGAILGGEGGDGGKEGGRATECSRHQREQATVPALPRPARPSSASQGLPRASQTSPGLVPFDHFRKESWVLM